MRNSVFFLFTETQMSTQILFHLTHSYRFVDKVNEGVKVFKATFSLFSSCLLNPPS